MIPPLWQPSILPTLPSVMFLFFVALSAPLAPSHHRLSVELWLLWHLPQRLVSSLTSIVLSLGSFTFVLLNTCSWVVRLNKWVTWPPQKTCSLTFSLQQLELLSGSQEVFPKNDEDDGQGDGSDEDVRPHDGHSEDGPRNNQCQLM